VEHKDSELRTKLVYSCERAQLDYEIQASAKSYALKLGTHYDLALFISKKIKDGYSPDVISAQLKAEPDLLNLSTKTIYNYIDAGLIPEVTTESLLEKRRRRKAGRRATRKVKKKQPKRLSIDQRPEQVESREQPGHWEIDLVVGPTAGSNAAVLTLVERKNRYLICRKLQDKSQESVRQALNSIEREYGPGRFRKLFRSITADNGSEFLDVEALEKSVFSNKKRTTFYYADPYCSWQRGTNENTNRILRRFIAKGKDIATFTRAAIRQFTEWINNYPRKILDYSSPAKLFEVFLNA
jgi:IS30 family transposase